jgi:hypothetical protein
MMKRRERERERERERDVTCMKDEKLVQHLAGRVIERKCILQTLVDCKAQWRLLVDTGAFAKDECLLAS